MNLTIRRFLIGVLGATVLVGGGCGAQVTTTERELSTLRSRVAELESSRRRLSSQLKTMEARMVSLEARGAARKGRSLPVVRVQPRRSERVAARPVEADEGSSDFTMAGQGYESMSPEAQDEDDGPRPVLTLDESGTRRPIYTGGSSSPRKSIDLANVSERLPVVPLPAAPSHNLADVPLPAPFSIDEQPAPPPENVMSQARSQVRGGQCREAVNSLGRLLANSPEHPDAAEAMLLRSQCFRRQGSHLRALGEAERLTRRYPSSNRVPSALMLMAESYSALGDGERARELFGQVLRRYPRSAAARRATARVQELGRGGARPREEQ